MPDTLAVSCFCSQPARAVSGYAGHGGPGRGRVDSDVSSSRALAWIGDDIVSGEVHFERRRGLDDPAALNARLYQTSVPEVCTNASAASARFVHARPGRARCARFCAVPLRSTTAQYHGAAVVAAEHTSSAAQHRQLASNARSNAIVGWPAGASRDEPAHCDPTKAGADTPSWPPPRSHMELRPQKPNGSVRPLQGEHRLAHFGARLTVVFKSTATNNPNRQRRKTAIAPDPHNTSMSPPVSRSSFPEPACTRPGRVSQTP
jgi:hypothetical protein